MSDIKVTGDVGGTIDTESTFQVADLAHLTDFTKVYSGHSTIMSLDH